ncbi:MAG TPA: hypothetical protein DEQ25_04765 [Methylophaga sp.]|jgi:hypothetical protein|nr:hypothetical protein [Methylophaga sp.]MBP26112.1 hypothetical protein [Methylophaga sp.]HCC80635.1 hypothetical protein [Methylophaga sp.]|tara:strand:+ start:1797 stop:1979 length:183 start_codon:yes stop_codon:yes gene_type:complete
MYADNAGAVIGDLLYQPPPCGCPLRARFAHAKTLISLDGVYAEAMLGAFPVLAFLLFTGK